jgi:FlaA1/EpsC-like NDP-sugar epimerase
MLEMGEPVRILYLAEQMIRLSGLTPYKDVPIVFVGLRPGEKLDEELTSNVEATLPTVVEKIRLVNTNHVDAEALAYGLERLGVLIAEGTDEDVRAAVRALVPEYLEFTPRVPFSDVEVPVDGAGTSVFGDRHAVRGPDAASLPALQPGANPAVNVARAS